MAESINYYQNQNTKIFIDFINSRLEIVCNCFLKKQVAWTLLEMRENQIFSNKKSAPQLLKHGRIDSSATLFE